MINMHLAASIIGMAVFAAAVAEGNQEVSEQVNSISETYLQPVRPLNHDLVRRQLDPLRRRPNYNGFPFGHRTIGSGNLLQGYILPAIENKGRNMFLKIGTNRIKTFISVPSQCISSLLGIFHCPTNYKEHVTMPAGALQDPGFRRQYQHLHSSAPEARPSPHHANPVRGQKSPFQPSTRKARLAHSSSSDRQKKQ